MIIGQVIARSLASSASSSSSLCATTTFTRSSSTPRFDAAHKNSRSVVARSFACDTKKSVPEKKNFFVFIYLIFLLFAAPHADFTGAQLVCGGVLCHSQTRENKTRTAATYENITNKASILMEHQKLDIATLARLTVPPEKTDGLCEDLGKIVAWVKHCQEVNTKGISLWSERKHRMNENKRRKAEKCRKKRFF